MMIELKTKRRWVMSIIEAVSNGPESRVVARASARQTIVRRQIEDGMSHTARLKAATRSMTGTGY